MNYIKQFFSYDFLFYVNPVRLGRVDKAFALAAVASIILAVVCKIWARMASNTVTKKLARRLVLLMSTVGITGIMWFGLRYQNVTVLGSHFVFLLIVLTGIIWFGYIVKYWWKNYTPERIAWEKEQVKLKYL